VNQVATLGHAQVQHISFLANSKYRAQLAGTRAGAVIVGEEDANSTALSRIVCDQPYAYFAQLSAFFNPLPSVSAGIHPSALIHPTACVDATAQIGALVVIGAGANIGAECVIGEGCSIGEEVQIGAYSRLYPRGVVYAQCVLGQRVIVHSGVVIGADGFGIAMHGGQWLKIPQIGRVRIGNDVEIGANTTIDRGALDDTVIEDGVKLDNQIQVAHNVKIGAHTAIAGCVGIAGSATIGRYCRIGGGAIVLGHLHITDRVEVSAGTVISKSITQAGTYTGLFPFSDNSQWRRNAAQLRHLDEMNKRIKQLETALQNLSKEST
jgi:UDP-3-O-[3-hydroxymyristoyl] glucosamine N-acyltransferase